MSNKMDSSSYRAQQATVARLTLSEKLDLVPAGITVVANVLGAIFTGAFRSTQRPQSYFRYVVLTAVRTVIRRTSPKQQHYFSPPTDDAYLKVCRNRGVQPKSEVLEDGTVAHWIGPQKPDKLIINFHGGGYSVPAADSMFEFMFRIVDVLKSQGKKASCLFLSYDLAPTAKYPRQLQQAAMLLDHVINNLRISPSNIVLTGDSAGGNLALALLSHLTHPHPSTSLSIPHVKLETPLRGAVLISPWVTFDLSAPSWDTNAYKDCLNREGGKQWSTAFLGEPWPHMRTSDPYNQPAIAGDDWWKGLMVDEVLIVAGGDEVLVDGIRNFARTFEKGMGEGRVDTFVARDEYHDQPSLDIGFGISEKDECQQAKLIKRWISSKL